jgi:predicted DNA binding CopG/RHH family protein
LEQVIGEKEEGYMKKKIYEEDGPISDKYEVVEDFLPSPDKLLPAISKTRISIEIDDEILEFFKDKADQNNQKYQRMMREVLKHYYEHYKDEAS